MKRYTVAFALLMTTAGSALAGNLRIDGSTPRQDRTVDLGVLSPTCRPFVDEPRDAISVVFRWGQRLSLAACWKTAIVPRIERGDVGALPGLVSYLEHASAASIAIYREAMSLAPPEIRILAAYGLGQSYLEIAMRARSALEPDDQPTRLALERLLDADVRAAIAAFDEVGFLAEDFPNAAHANAVVKLMVKTARMQSRLLREP